MLSGHPFPGVLAKDSRLFLGLYFVPIDILRSQASLAPGLVYIAGKTHPLPTLGNSLLGCP